MFLVVVAMHLAEHQESRRSGSRAELVMLLSEARLPHPHVLVALAHPRQHSRVTSGLSALAVLEPERVATRAQNSVEARPSS